MDLIAKTRKDELNDLIDKAKDWAVLNGLTMRPKGEISDCVEFAPFTLVPSSFPRAGYEELRELQLVMNELVHRVARDDDFLRKSLERCARVDDFTARLLEVLNQSEKSTQSVTLGLLRSDYMQEASGHWNDATARCKQVEVNTIASGHGWIGAACSSLHRYIFEEMNLMMKFTSNLPKNNPLEGLCSGMCEAWKIYDNPSAVILFLVEDYTRNIADQRFHEYALRRMDSRIRVIRHTLSQIAKQGQLEGPERRLLVNGREVALVYMRAGYSPEHYPGPAEWRARLLIERSHAIKCPTIGYHLAGCKKIQQLLAQPEVLERFLIPEDSARLRRIFTGLYSLEKKDGDDILEAALKRPHDFVLKPQREGGLNNIFGENVRKKLSEMRHTEERNSWILMDRIVPFVHRNLLIRPGATNEEATKLEDVTSELGIFSVILVQGDKILVNEVVGHSLRTKLADCDEAGVHTGHGTIDSPFLV